GIVDVRAEDHGLRGGQYGGRQQVRGEAPSIAVPL
ncbi:MAG: hypothetical protein AVDCRST_MAG01-01-3325, partial [uncultured Rubrobacteraceae bacterium]